MNILTFDIEDWFHINFNKDFNNETKWNKFESRIENSTNAILDILSENNIKATFFCLGWVASKYPNLVKKIHSFGHDIGSHSNIHNLASHLSQSEFEEDLIVSLDSLEQVIGEKIVVYRAPAFSIGQSNSWAFETLIKHGIQIDCSVFPAYHDFGGFPEIGKSKPFLIESNGSFLKEFPMSLGSILGKKAILTGGGFFRLFPYYFIKNSMDKSNYVMTYFHPRDFDYGQPVLKNLSLMRRFKSYYGLKNALDKFKLLVNDFQFQSVLEADRQIDWDKADKIKFN